MASSASGRQVALESLAVALGRLAGGGRVDIAPSGSARRRGALELDTGAGREAGALVVQRVASSGGRARERVTALVRYRGAGYAIAWDLARSPELSVVSAPVLGRAAGALRGLRAVPPQRFARAVARGEPLDPDHARWRRPAVVFVVSRIGGEDGVSLEVMHWAAILRGLGVPGVIITGRREDSDQLRRLESGRGGVAVRVVRAADPDPRRAANRREFELLFGRDAAGRRSHPVQEALEHIDRRAAMIARGLRRHLRELGGPMVLDLENLALPWHQSCLAAASMAVVRERRLPLLCRVHDLPDDRPVYGWERVPAAIKDRISVFERQPSSLYVTINSHDRARLVRRGLRGVELIPNAVDARDPVLMRRPSARRLRQLRRHLLGKRAGDFIFLLPVRPVRRKRLDIALSIAARLQRRHPGIGPVSLVVTHGRQDAPASEIRLLMRAARAACVNLVFADALRSDSGHSFDPLVYHHLADATLYPSDFEGYGNALIEAFAAGAPVFVNRYSVYREDIEPAGAAAVGFDIPPSVDFAEFERLGLAAHDRNPRLARELDRVADELADLLRMRAVPGGPLSGRWLRMVQESRRFVARHNDYPRIGSTLVELLWSALSAQNRYRRVDDVRFL